MRSYCSKERELKVWTSPTKLIFGPDENHFYRQLSEHQSDDIVNLPTMRGDSCVYTRQLQPYDAMGLLVS